MSRTAPPIHDLQARGIDSRTVPNRGAERRALEEEGAESKARSDHEPLRFFLVAAIAVIAAVAAVVAIVGPGTIF